MKNCVRFLVSLIAATVVPLALAQHNNSPDTGWLYNGGDSDRTRYSPLSQINLGNVNTLKVAWTYHTGEKPKGRTPSIECTPIIAEGMTYVTTELGNVVALDPGTGRQIWKYITYGPDARDHGQGPFGLSRGVSFWSDPLKQLKRVVFGTTDGRLIVLDASTGLPDPAFGNAGVVDLRAGLGITREITYGMSSPPAIFENLIIVGVMLEDARKQAPGDVRAFDIRTGAEVWRFHTIPQPGEFGNSTWKKGTWRLQGGANPWGGLTVDKKRGIVFAGLGAVGDDNYGGERPGDDLFGNSLLALDVRTGKRIWHRQLVHHDLWNYDLASPPSLITVERNGKLIDVVAEVPKTGYLYMFERDTGKPIFDLVERLVPAVSDVPGERPSPTQPIPVAPPPVSRQGFSLDDVTDLSPASHAYVMGLVKGSVYGPAFNPPSMRKTIYAPSLYGGAPWSGTSFDPVSHVLYVSSNNVASVIKMKMKRPYPIPGLKRPSLLPSVEYGQEDDPSKGPGISGPGTFTILSDQDGYPGLKPPWGTLTAIDVNKGTFLWRVPLGEYPELTARGIPPTGTFNLGGSIVTQGGLLFIAATKDDMFRAFDKATGKIVWTYKLPAAGYAAPSTYTTGGKQYLVIAAGGGSQANSATMSDSFVAFTLPD